MPSAGPSLVRSRLEELASRSSCVRRQVGALALPYGWVGLDGIVAEGWNFETHGTCAIDCPRAISAAIPGSSSYTEGLTRCIAVHAEDMVIRTLVAKGVEMHDVYIVTTEDPCYQCKEQLQKFDLSWQVFYL